ncbi:MAG: 50S ribosomal protein L11 methyltransferase [Desulfatitalea sp.]|nr:50S ribosomal protein L11 methyltransferase [Desulfatitalea sp.]NNJ99031.1 50S ribosomal protein L11 methyltransferase [Desulfatitalea sp.]
MNGIQMQWIEIKVTFESQDAALTAELIADVFHQAGTTGVVMDDPNAVPPHGWGSDALPPPAAPAVTGYLPADARYEGCRLNLTSALAALAGRHPFDYSLSCNRVDEQDWAEAWKDFFYPEAMTDTLVVKPSWREYTPRHGQRIIEIDPGMAFGTGTHPTTALCARMMEKFIQPGDSVLDVGTGSGILLIAAYLLGAGRLSGVDIDPQAVAVARENIRRNKIPRQLWALHCGHLADGQTQIHDLVVANILAEVIVQLLDQVPVVLRPGGVLIASGIITAWRDKVAREMAAHGCCIVDVVEDGEWVALVGRLVDPREDSG